MKQGPHSCTGRLQDVAAKVGVLDILPHCYSGRQLVLVVDAQILVVEKRVLEGHLLVEVLVGPKVVAEASDGPGACSMLGELLAIPSNPTTARKYSAVPSSSHQPKTSSPAEVLDDLRLRSSRITLRILRPTPTPLAAR